MSYAAQYGVSSENLHSQRLHLLPAALSEYSFSFKMVGTEIAWELHTASFTFFPRCWHVSLPKCRGPVMLVHHYHVYLYKIIKVSNLWKKKMKLISQMFKQDSVQPEWSQNVHFQIWKVMGPWVLFPVKRCDWPSHPALKRSLNSCCITAIHIRPEGREQLWEHLPSWV